MNSLQEAADNMMNKEYRSYGDDLALIGKITFIMHIQPRLRERNYTLLQENGKYRLERADGTKCTPNNARGDQELWDVLGLLELNVPGTGGRLGDYMPEYIPEEDPVGILMRSQPTS